MPPPPCCPCDPEFWKAYADELKSKLDPILPHDIVTPSHTHALQSSIDCVSQARITLQKSKSLRDAIEKKNHQNVEKNQSESGAESESEDLKLAQELVVSAQSCYDKAEQSWVHLAPLILNSLEDGFLGKEFDDRDLLRYSAIVAATPEKLASWCAQGSDPTLQMQQLFLSSDVDVLRRFFAAGSPRHGEYGRAMQLYIQLTTTTTDKASASATDADSLLLHRLAMAVALELCCELEDSAHSVERNPLNPYARYQHYRDAYLHGELDPAFPTLSPWEMRMVINSDASERALQWGRDSLKNYRPDLVLMDDPPQWRYCYIVRQDVEYKDPVWYKPQRSYDQILSGGGKCGPRAWYGRFICKAFGIPTWGVRQPGHAAMSRWTSTGQWMICLGAGFDVSEWDGRCGLDFLLEAQARTQLGDDREYVRKVLRLELLALFRGESSASLRSAGVPDDRNLWFALSFLQRKWIAMQPNSVDSSTRTLMESSTPSPTTGIVTRIERILRKSIPPHNKTHYVVDNDSIIIPASSAMIDSNNAGKAHLMKSFSGGIQLFLGQDGYVSFALQQDLPPRAVSVSGLYQLTLLVCTVHRIQEPLLVTIRHDEKNHNNHTNSDPDTLIYPIQLPYTEGMWSETLPVQIALLCSTNETLTLKRQELKFGVAIKYIKISPIVHS